MFRCFAPILILLALCAPAQARPAGPRYRRSGELRWAFDDIVLKSGGRIKRATRWSQNYELGMKGPLGHPLIGEADTGATFSRGLDVNQAVTYNDPEKNVLGYKFAARMFPKKVRSFLTFDPHVSRTKTTQSWGLPLVSRDLIDSSWGYATGLNLPKLPGISISRNYSSQRDASAASAVHQETARRTETIAYSKGPMRLRLSHDARDVRDRLAGIPDSINDEKEANLEINDYDIKTGGLRTFFFRANYRGIKSGEAARPTWTKTGVTDLYLTTVKKKTLSWNSYGIYANNLLKDLKLGRGSARHNLSLISERALRKGRLDNRINAVYANGTTASESLSDAFGAEKKFMAGRVNTRADVSTGWSRSQNAGALFSDSFLGRVTFIPRRGRDMFLEGGTDGATPLRDAAGGSRRNRWGLGASLQPSRFVDLQLTAYRIRSRDFPSGIVSVADQFTLRSQMVPLPRLTANISYNMSFNRSTRGSASANRTLALNLDYTPLAGARLSAQATFEAKAYNALLEASYVVGKTVLKLTVDHRDFSTPSSFTHTGFSLSRRL